MTRINRIKIGNLEFSEELKNQKEKAEIRRNRIFFLAFTFVTFALALWLA